MSHEVATRKSIGFQPYKNKIKRNVSFFGTFFFCNFGENSNMKTIIRILIFFFFGIFSAQDDCVFNNDYKGLSAEAIHQFDTNLKIKFNPKDKVSTAILKNGDLLKLTIGGCYHMNYYAEITSNIDFKNKKQLEQKLLWLVKSFFGKGYDEDYQKIIRNHEFKLSEKSTSNKKIFEINFKTKDVTNIIYETFIFEKINSKITKISTSFYMN